MLVIVQFAETRPVPNATWPFIVNKVPSKGWSHKWWTPPSPFDYTLIHPQKTVTMEEKKEDEICSDSKNSG